MSFDNHNSSPERPPFGIQDQMVANSQQGVPVPYVAGTRKVAVNWISPVYNLKAVPASGGKKGGKGGGKGGGGSSRTYNYFGTVAGALCTGPVDGIVSIILNGQEVWPGGKAWKTGINVHVGDLYVYDAQTWIVQADHLTSDDNAPGNVAYWKEYEFSPTTEAYDDITIPVQGATTTGKSKGQINGPSVYGTMRVYWGKPGQAQDPHLATAGNDAGDDHPAYQGICYIVLINFWFGSGTTTAPNIEVVVRRTPQQSIITGSPAALTDGQACMAAVAAEVLTDQNMLGLPTALLDDTSWQNAANVLDGQSNLTAGSVLMDTQDTLRSFLDVVTQMTDNFVRFNPDTGLIEMGVYRHGTTPAAGSYKSLNSDSLTTRPKLSNGGWADVQSRVVVRFTDRSIAYQDNTEKADDLRAFFVIQEHRTTNLDRPYICRASQAIAHGAETLRTVGRPILNGQLEVRREIGRSIRAGDYVLLDIDVEPNVTTLFAFCRVTQRTIPQTGPIKLSVIGDNTLSPVAWTNPTPPIVPVQTNVPVIDTLRILEAPFGLNDVSGNVIVLAQRPTGLISGFHFYFDTDTDGSFVMLGGQTTFAATATLMAAVADDDTTISVTVPDQVDGDLFTLQPGVLAAKNDELLLFIVSVATGTDAGQVKEDGNGYALVEVCSVSASTLVSAGNYTLTVLRGRLGTVAEAFTTANTEVWIAKRSDLPEFSHAEFATLIVDRQAGTDTFGYFRLTPFTYIAELLLSDATSQAFHFPVKSVVAPTLTLTSPATNPLTLTSPAYPYSLTVSGTWASENDNLSSWQVQIKKDTDTGPRNLGSAVFAPTSSAAFNLTAILEKAGNYTLTLTAYDANGLSTTVIVNITATGAGAKVAIPSWSYRGSTLSQATTEAAAAASPNYGDFGPLTATCQTPGATVKWATRYMIQRGDTLATSWSDWTAFADVLASTPVHVPLQDNHLTASGGASYVNVVTQQEFKAYATLAGMTDSDVAYINFVDAAIAPVIF